MVSSNERDSATYAAAGVDIDAAARALDLIKAHARSTYGPQVLSDLGLFAGLFRAPKGTEPVLVASTDSVGTKLKIAVTMDRHDTVGIDIVNHCVNDILTCGAMPLFFLDYLGLGRLVPERTESLVKGMAQACRAAGCALIGGEMAELPGIYAANEYDVVGFIVGVVERSQIIDGKAIATSDVLLGLPSSGLHTNGYTLARRIFGLDGDPAPLTGYQLEGRSLGEVLLEPHRCYLSVLRDSLSLVKGLAHITGGGFIDNVPRVLPAGLAARFYVGSWLVPPVFRLIQERGNVAEAEMYRTFNMGIGMVVACGRDEATELSRRIPEAIVIGEVIRHDSGPRVLIA